MLREAFVRAPPQATQEQPKLDQFGWLRFRKKIAWIRGLGQRLILAVPTLRTEQIELIVTSVLLTPEAQDSDATIRLSMNSDHELCRKAGLLKELEVCDEYVSQFQYYALAVGLIAALLKALAVSSNTDNLSVFANWGFLLGLVFGLVSAHNTLVKRPALLKRARRIVHPIAGQSAIGEKSILPMVGVTTQELFDLGFRYIPRGREAIQRDQRVSVLKRGSYDSSDVAVEEEFAVVMDGKPVARAKVLAITSGSVWEFCSSTTFEINGTAELISQGVARSNLLDLIDASDEIPIEVVSIGLQSLAEKKQTAKTELSMERSENLTQNMMSNGFVWSECTNIGYLSLDLGASSKKSKRGAKIERRDRSAIVAIFSNEMSEGRALPFQKALAEVISSSTVAGIELEKFDKAGHLRVERRSPIERGAEKQGVANPPLLG